MTYETSQVLTLVFWIIIKSLIQCNTILKAAYVNVHKVRDISSANVIAGASVSLQSEDY